MENATKALLIAAAVLVAILIISLGIGIFNMASEQVNNAGDLSEYEIQKFNEKFTKYEGESRSGSDVNALLDTVFNHNNAQEDATTCVEVKYQPKTGSETVKIDDINSISTSPEKVSTGKRYKVTASYSTVTKLITSIKVEEK